MVDVSMNGAQAVATTGDPAFAVDCGGKILAWNRAAAHLLGVEASEALHQPCWRVVRGRDLSSNRYCSRNCPIREMALRGEPVHQTKIILQGASGEEVCVAMSTLVLQGTAGKEIVHLLQGLSGAAEHEAPFPLHPSLETHRRLSPRQLDVLRLLGDGKRTRELSETLGISPATVRHHIQEIFRHLRVHSRIEAVAVARRIGLI